MKLNETKMIHLDYDFNREKILKIRNSFRNGDKKIQTTKGEFLIVAIYPLQDEFQAVLKKVTLKEDLIEAIREELISLNEELQIFCDEDCYDKVYLEIEEEIYTLEEKLKKLEA